MNTTQTLVERLYDVTPDEDIELRLADSTRIRGTPSRIDRDEAGIRIEVCPYDGDAPQYRVRAARRPRGWAEPEVERRPMLGEWEHHGRVVAVESV